MTKKQALEWWKTNETGFKARWVSATAKTSNGFYIIGAYLTDIWAISGDNAAQIAKNHMYIRKFRESK